MFEFCPEELAGQCIHLHVWRKIFQIQKHPRDSHNTKRFEDFFVILVPKTDIPANSEF